MSIVENIPASPILRESQPPEIQSDVKTIDWSLNNYCSLGEQINLSYGFSIQI